MSGGCGAPGPAVAPTLHHLAAIGFGGADARTFLGRQLTCDVGLLAPGDATPGAWLTPKGRVLTLLHVVDTGEPELLAVLPAALADETMKRLGLFVLRDDVRIRRRDDLRIAGLVGGAEALLARWKETAGLPATFALAPGVSELALLLGTAAQVDTACRERLAAGATELDGTGWTLAQIRAGLPALESANKEAFLPQMLNLDRLGGVSFTKGCYPGQEIVARTQHLGRLKRRMFPLRGPGARIAAPGEPIFSEHGGDAVGRVVVAAPCGDAQELLAVISLDARDAGSLLHLGAAAGPALEVASPPYALED